MKIALFILSLFIADYFIPVRSDEDPYKLLVINASFDNGDHRVVTVRYPAYADLSIRASVAGHRLSTWRYCGYKGWLTCEAILVNGVVYYEALFNKANDAESWKMMLEKDQYEAGAVNLT